MRNLFLVLFALGVFPLTANAIVRTVSNNPAGGAQFATLQAAYTASANGDTLILEGTNLNYFINEYWNKSLVVIGIGFNPQKQNALRSRISQAWPGGGVDMVGLQSSAGGSKFYGIEFTGTYGGVNIQLSTATNNMLFENCKFNGFVTFAGLSANNWVFRNCIFDSNNALNVHLSVTTSFIFNILFTNCVFDGYVEGFNNPNVNFTFDHCLFLTTTTTTFSNLQNATVRNSIFMNGFPCCGATNSTFLNNLSRIAGTFPPSGTGNTGSGNIAGVDPTFTTYTNGTLYTASYNYNLLPGSPAIGAGTLGADIGVHGGNSGFSRFGEVLHNPIVRSMIIQNATVSPGGTLEVDVVITKPTDN